MTNGKSGDISLVTIQKFKTGHFLEENNVYNYYKIENFCVEKLPS